MPPQFKMSHVVLMWLKEDSFSLTIFFFHFPFIFSQSLFGNYSIFLEKQIHKRGGGDLKVEIKVKRFLEKQKQGQSLGSKLFGTIIFLQNM